MRAMKVALMVASVVCVLGMSMPASACNVTGTVVCASDESIGVSGVAVTFTSAVDTVTMTSGADGVYSGHVSGWEQPYDVSLTDVDYYCGATTTPVPTIVVDDPVQCPGTPACVATIPEGLEFPYCPDRPIGKPKAECALFGLTVLDKVDGESSTATSSAALAVVKAGGCYGIVTDVDVGDALSSPNGQSISHVTYCVCP